MKPKYIVVLCFVVIAALLIIYAGYDSVLNTDSTTATITKTNTKVKPFEAETIDGEQFKFNSSEEFTVFEGFAEWCLPCRTSVPQALLFSKRNPDVNVVGVAFRDVDFKTKEFLKEFGEFETTIISTSKIENSLGLNGIPQTLFVLDGRVIYRIYGSSNLKDLENVLSLVKRELSSSK